MRSHWCMGVTERVIRPYEVVRNHSCDEGTSSSYSDCVIELALASGKSTNSIIPRTSPDALSRTGDTSAPEFLSDRVVTVGGRHADCCWTLCGPVGSREAGAAVALAKSNARHAPKASPRVAAFARPPDARPSSQRRERDDSQRRNGRARISARPT